MKKYNFYDTDFEGQEEYDICGEDYIELIRVCCKYCSVFSVVVTCESLILKKLQPFEISKPDNIQFTFSHYDLDLIDVKFYRVCPQLFEIISNATNGIFEWINGWGFDNPSDPTFYRDDGSVFFTSLIHNGICTLMPADDEDVSIVLQSSLWNRERNTGDGSVY